MFWQNDSGPESRTIGTAFALPDPVESVARCNDPRVRNRASEVFAKVFENRGMFRRHCGKVIEGFVYTSSQTRGRYVVAENPLVRHLSKETRLWNEFTEH